MKKLLALFMALAMCLSLCACGGGGTKCTVQMNNGGTEQLSIKEIIDIRENDGRRWKDFSGARISGTGKITKIETGASGFYEVPLSVVSGGKEFKYQYVQVTINDWLIIITRKEVFSDLYVGDEVRFDGTIGKGASSMYLYVGFGNDSDDDPQQHIFLVS